MCVTEMTSGMGNMNYFFHFAECKKPVPTVPPVPPGNQDYVVYSYFSYLKFIWLSLIFVFFVCKIARRLFIWLRSLLYLFILFIYVFIYLFIILPCLAVFRTFSESKPLIKRNRRNIDDAVKRVDDYRM